MEASLPDPEGDAQLLESDMFTHVADIMIQKETLTIAIPRKTTLGILSKTWHRQCHQTNKKRFDQTPVHFK